MSEYRYCELAAVDQPLDGAQRAELRAGSSRANIPATSFTNAYHRGEFKGDSMEWMEAYFDAHVYSASWGSCALLLRLPRDTLDEAQLMARPGERQAWLERLAKAH